jgi:hypothetical protein
MRVAHLTLAILVLLGAISVGVELASFNQKLGGLPHMSTSQTWQSPNVLSSLMFLLVAVSVASVTSMLLPTNRMTLTITGLFFVVSCLALWALHRTCVGMMSSGSSGPVAWW